MSSMVAKGPHFTLSDIAAGIERWRHRGAIPILGVLGASKKWWLPPAVIGLISWVLAGIYFWYFWSFPIE